ncbi:hypothetical protein [Sinomonas atrocyanea]
MNASRGSRGDHRDYSVAPDGLAPTQQAVISATAEALRRGVPGAVIVSGSPGRARPTSSRR